MKKVITDGNSACAHIAYLMNEMAVIYPITPSSTMGEVCDSFRSEGKKNIFGNSVNVVEMQSEAGVAGAVHGSLSSGTLTTTFTSSQGLLLMLPDMYKIAGELLPAVFYVASRSVATHALNIFCDHSDIYSALKTGFNIISCSNVQEVNDIAIATQLSAMKSETPFICFFDGFRTSHEINTIEQSTAEEIKSIIDYDHITRFKKRAMNNVTPFCKGTNQNPDVFFQNRVASLNYYKNVISVVKDSLQKVKSITNREYDTVEYYGDSKAQDVIVSMGSSIDTLKIATKSCHKSGVINVRLLKPFDEKTFLEKLPKSVQNITVLERNLDPNGEDCLYSYILSAIYKSNRKCKILRGVYGLGGKEFTPDMAIAVYNNMRNQKKDNFTLGIYDNLTNTSLNVQPLYHDDTSFACRIYGFGSDGSVSSAKNIIKILGEKNGLFAQGYFDYDSKKSGSLTISHIRTSNSPINKPFNSEFVNISLCNNSSFLTKYDLTSCIRNDGLFLINCDYDEAALDRILPNRIKEDIKNKHLSLYTIDANSIAKKFGLNGKINTIMQTALFKLTKFIPFATAYEKIKKSIITTYSKKGEKIVKSNLDAIEYSLNHLKKVDISKLNLNETLSSNIVGSDYYEEIIKPINNQEGNYMPVSKFNADGKMPTDTSKLEKRGIASEIPEWIPENCIQCGRCSLSCPHACLRAVEFESDKKHPNSFKTATSFQDQTKQYRMQISPLDCTGCGVCSEVCPVKNKALKMNHDLKFRDKEIVNFEYLKELNPTQREEYNSVKSLQFKAPYFEFSGACAGCGETPYIKLATQLFGDRMLIANATGCSSIYGGTFPICPYSKDNEGFGPSWANSLFEDNAEFGYGIALAQKLNRENFIAKLKANKHKYSKTIKEIVENFLNDTNDTKNVKELVNRLSFYRYTHHVEDEDREVFDNIQLFIKPSVWIIGGDGWAFDIGFGGLDHVVSTGENVNILILDTEVYSNTGGQSSKSTPRGASAKFNASGKTNKKKDILSMLMTYKDGYVASVSMGADPDQCVKAFIEAEKYDGPSVILAYAPCINHGYDMRFSQTHEKNAVLCGYNTLFRYNPELDSPMQIDSHESSFDYNEFLNSENRFAILSKMNPENKDRLDELNKMDAKNRRENYKKFTNK